MKSIQNKSRKINNEFGRKRIAKSCLSLCLRERKKLQIQIAEGSRKSGQF